MKRLTQILSVSRLSQIITICCSAGFLSGVPLDSFAASVVQRGTVSRGAPRTNTTGRITTAIPTPQPEIQPADTVIEEAVIEPETIVIENRSSQFDQVLNTISTDSKDIAGDALADMIRKQRAALDASDNQETATKLITAALADNKSTCDSGLRTCMREKCGNDFSKCAGDGDTIWGDKMESCRRGLTCSGKEYALFAPEIKADRDLNAKMAGYNNALDCGNQYNSCIISRCGAMLNGCIGKADADGAIAACASVAKNCQSVDSGLASRTMQVFATLRESAEVQVKKDEARLYELRDLMANQCKKFGASFDERSLDCVFTVNFFAGDSATPYASKKAYGGNSFDCDQNWFGVDVTTFKENAYRLTRSQTAASSAMLGSGLGVAAGALTPGAIDRAIDTQKAKKAANQAESTHEKDFGNKPESSASSDKAKADKDTDNNTTKTDSKEDSNASSDTSERRAESRANLKQAEDNQKKKMDAYAMKNLGNTADTKKESTKKEIAPPSKKGMD